MKISIVGLGKMGSLVQKTAQEENIEIASSIDPHQKDADFSEIDEKSLHGTDVCICFTQPTAALENIEKIASLKKKIVMATTGWEDKLEQAVLIFQQHSAQLIYASNFSPCRLTQAVLRMSELHSQHQNAKILIKHNIY